jgi:DNA-binding CsgD family transcriptional regulator
MLTAFQADILPAPRPIVADRLPLSGAPARTSLTPGVIWGELLEGRMVIVAHAVSDDSASLTLKARHANPTTPSVRTGARIMERVFSGCSQKALGIELGRSSSLVSARCSQTLRHFGLAICVRQAPLALVMIAAARHWGLATLGGYSVARGGEPGTLVVRMSRPEAIFRSRLSRAEFDTLRHLISGMTYERVAAVRARSPRTVANQFRTVTEKLRAYGRFQLIRLAMLRETGTEMLTS